MNRGFVITLETAGILVIAWAILLGVTLGASISGLTLTFMLSCFGVSVIRGQRRAVGLGWSATAVMGILAIVDDFAPVLVLVWCGFAVLAVFLHDFRERLPG